MGIARCAVGDGWETVLASDVRVGDCVKISSARVAREVTRVTDSVDGDLVKVQYADGSRDWVPAAQRMWRDKRERWESVPPGGCPC